MAQKVIERKGAVSVPYVHRYPQVIGGVCEFCGVMDPSKPSQVQYTLCPHYKSMQLQCSYCDESKDPDEVIYRSTLNVYDSPINSGELVVCCDSFTCTGKHQARFQR